MDRNRRGNKPPKPHPPPKYDFKTHREKATDARKARNTGMPGSSANQHKKVWWKDPSAQSQAPPKLSPWKQFKRPGIFYWTLNPLRIMRMLWRWYILRFRPWAYSFPFHIQCAGTFSGTAVVSGLMQVFKYYTGFYAIMALKAPEKAQKYCIKKKQQYYDSPEEVQRMIKEEARKSPPTPNAFQPVDDWEPKRDRAQYHPMMRRFINWSLKPSAAQQDMLKEEE
eukprot:TRINITY_DN65980_c0_g1_i1.p2 TRINITY_DN65980_c0_g1~~TRINITY_DN65980_c0_g1_i1.p2  ORF type:complete len:244 (-),score=19.21 TRINITY_DN65980_c0_g1_i1:972-1643(-)